MVAEEFSHLSSVLGIFVNSELKVFRKLLVEFLVVFSVLSNFGNELNDLLDKVLFNNFQDLVLLQELSGNIEGQVFRVDDTLDEVKVIGDEFLAVVHDKDSSNIELDVIFFLFCFEEVERGTFGNEEDGLELELSFN